MQEGQVLYHFGTRRSDPRVRPASRRHDKDPPAGSCTFERRIRGPDPFDSRVGQKQPAGHGGLTGE